MEWREVQEFFMSLANSPSNTNHKKKKVLLVDDMPQVRQDLRQLLELTGLFEVVAEAGDGMEAVRQVKNLSLDAVVLDLEMHGLDGVEVARLIKAHSPSVRVIIFSAYGSYEEMELARNAGADGFVMKGDRYEILVDALLGKSNTLDTKDFQKGE
jgi:two-component system, NarL family, nitrate/nitrite response regulator NarL